MTSRTADAVSGRGVHAAIPLGRPFCWRPPPAKTPIDLVEGDQSKFGSFEVRGEMDGLESYS
eukprot:scaffold99808_cov30-Tisochrysis_lutea.AAC.2